MDSLHLTKQQDLKLFSVLYQNPLNRTLTTSMMLAYNLEEVLNKIQKESEGQVVIPLVINGVLVKDLLVQVNLGLSGIVDIKGTQSANLTDNYPGTITTFVNSLKLVADRFVKNSRDKVALLKILEKIKIDEES